MPPNHMSPFFRCLRWCPYFTYTYRSTMIVNSSRTFIWSSSSSTPRQLRTQRPVTSIVTQITMRTALEGQCPVLTLPRLLSAATLCKETNVTLPFLAILNVNSEFQWIHKIVENILQCLSFVCCPHQKCRWRNIPSSSERKMTATISVCGPDM